MLTRNLQVYLTDSNLWCNKISNIKISSSAINWRWNIVKMCKTVTDNIFWASAADLVSSWTWNGDFDLERFSFAVYFNKFLWLSKCDNNFIASFSNYPLALQLNSVEMDTFVACTRASSTLPPFDTTMDWGNEKNQNEARFKSMAAKRVEEKPCSMNRLSDVQLSLQPLNLCSLVCIVFFRIHFWRSAIIFSYAFMDTQRTVIIFHCIIFGCVPPDRCFCTFYLSSVDWSFFFNHLFGLF